MLQQFVDRKRELEFLNKIYKRDGFSLVVIYGRRRVGKTSLLKEFLAGKKGCYVLLTNESVRENIKYIKYCLASSLGKEYYAKLDVDNLYDLFRLIEFGGNKFVMVLDEFPYLLEISRSALSVFQKIVDEILSQKNVMLILSGSSLSMMENDVLGYRSPLYGRNIHPWKLQPFDFGTIYHIYGDVNRATEVFFTFGNIPYYLNFYNPSKSLIENIREAVLSKGMALYDEPLILLREEFRESRIYRLILKYISLGYRSIGKLCSATGMDKSNISKYLDTLRETGIVEQIIPFMKKRGSIYQISDSFMDFWFRFVYPYRGELEMGNVEKVISVFKKEKNSYFGQKFERLVMHLLKLGIFPELRKYENFTKWWHKGTEIDIVGLKNNELLVGECKWSSNVNGKRILRNLKSKAENMNWKGPIKYVIFAKSFSVKPSDIYAYDLRDIENLVRKKY